jgi:DNA-binding transcriptional ArsR family regulator
MEPAVDKTGYLLEFFKVLADEKRLQIVGLLARQDYSVEELAAILNLSSATVSHHLRRLTSAGLVQAAARQHYHVYSLRLQTLHEMSQQILSQNTLQETTEDLDSTRSSASPTTTMPPSVAN